MQTDISPEGELALGRFNVIFFSIFNIIVAFVLPYFLIPIASGILVGVILCVSAFCGIGGVFFLLYILPAKPLNSYRQNDGSYVILRYSLVNILFGVISTVAAIVLPAAFILMLVAIPLMTYEASQLSFSDIINTPIIDLLSNLDAAHGFIFTLIPLMFIFPWLYLKFLRKYKSHITKIFSPTGIKLDKSGLEIIGFDARVIPWAWITSVEAGVHAQAEVLILKGSSQLDKLVTSVDRRIPAEIRNEFEWKGAGVPMKLDFLRVRASELAEVINADFLSKRRS
jgi:hypothetical protein